MEQDYYLPTDILPLVQGAGKTKSAFYRAFRQGKVVKVMRDGREVYEKEVVDKFLRGEFETRGRRRKTQAAQVVGSPSSLAGGVPVIDIVQREDTAALYMMETSALPCFEDAIVPPTIQSWISRNSYVYWAQYDPRNRRNVWAVLGILPLREEIIVRLLHKELSPKDIPIDAILPYEPGTTYSCYITSTTAVEGHQGAIKLLMQRVLSYWRRHNISVERVYIDVPDVSLEDTPPLVLTNEYFFAPPYGLEERRGDSTHWTLWLIYRNGNPFVRAYQQAVERQKKERELVLATLPADALSGDAVAHIKTRPRNFMDLRDRFHPLGSDGQITKHARFRQVNTDDDILAIIQINNAIFPPSTGRTAEVFLPILRAWWQKNPDVFRVLEVGENIVGFVSLLPLAQNIIDGIVRNEIRMSQLKGEDIQEYLPEKPIDIFVWTLGVHPDIQGQEKRMYGWYLAMGMWNFMNDLGNRGVEIRVIYARSDEVDGINMSFGLGFEPVPPPPGVKKLVFQLDFSKSNAFLADYKQALAKYREARIINGFRS